MRAFTRFGLWLARGDNAFNVAIFLTIPPLAAITAIGFF
jgi:hypothetical protein